MLFDTVSSILRTPGSYLVKPKLLLFFYFLKYWIKKLLIELKILQEPHSEKLFEYSFKTGNYDNFLRIFQDIFIKSQYYFEAKSKRPVIFDLGAHIGLSVLYFKLLYPRSEIIAIEADKGAFQVLENNVASNKLSGVTLHNFAVSEKEGTRAFYLNKDTPAYWGNSLGKQTISKPKRIKVKTKRLSPLLKRKVDLIKIDIEGEEGKVIRELAKAQKLEFAQRLIIEYHQWGPKENNLDILLRLLRKNDFVYMFDYSLKTKVALDPLFKLAERYAKSYNMLIYAYKAT